MMRARKYLDKQNLYEQKMANIDLAAISGSPKINLRSLIPQQNTYKEVSHCYP